MDKKSFSTNFYNINEQFWRSYSVKSIKYSERLMSVTYIKRTFLILCVCSTTIIVYNTQLYTQTVYNCKENVYNYLKYTFI